MDSLTVIKEVINDLSRAGGCTIKDKLLDSPLFLTEASIVGLRPRVKRLPNTLLQQECPPILPY